MPVRHIDVHNILMDVKLKNGSEYLGCDTPGKPLGDHEKVVAIWHEGRIRVFPLEEVEYYEMYEAKEKEHAENAR